MIKISHIKQYMYCPMKLYHDTHLHNSDNSKYKLPVEIKRLKIDIKDMIYKNMRRVKKDMVLSEIENILSEGIDPYTKNTAESIKSMNIGLESSQINDIIDDAYFTIKITALRCKKAMIIFNKNGYEIIDMFFPNCINSFLIKDESLNVVGVCDKIEIINGKYYPILLKSCNPPIKGVWHQDEIELVSNAILIEEEFEADVYVGFVDYEKIAEKRPVVMDVKLRKEYFDILRKVKSIVEMRSMPTVEKNLNKCENCEYYSVCIND